MFYLCYLYLFTYSGVLTCRVTVAGRVSLVEQELITLPEYLNSPLVFIGVPAARFLFFCVGFCRSCFLADLFLYSYEYKNKSARRGAQFVPIGMPTTC